MSGVPDDARRSVVELTIPAETQFLSAARLVAASLATDLDFSIDDIDELRIAVDEALNVFIQSEPAPSSIHVAFTFYDRPPGTAGELRIEGSARGLAGPAQTSGDSIADELVVRILEAITDSFSFEADGFVLTKTSTHAPL
jgi:hypothetical protein